MIRLELPEIKSFKNNARQLLLFTEFKSINALMKKHSLNREEAEQFLLQNYDNFRIDFNEKSKQNYDKKIKESKIKKEKQLKRSRENKLNEIIKKRLELINRRNILIDVKTYVIYKNTDEKAPWKNQEHSIVTSKSNPIEIGEEIDDYLKKQYPREETFGYIYLESYTYQILKENVKHVEKIDIPMKRAIPIKLPFLKWFDSIDEISYDDHNDKCVVNAIIKWWNIKKPKTITDIFQQASVKLYHKKWNEQDGVTARMIKFLCEEKHVACLGIDQYDNKFIKYQPNIKAGSKDRKPIIFYQVTGHFYLITSDLKNIGQTFKDEQNITSCNVLVEEEEKTMKTNYVNFEDFEHLKKNDELDYDSDEDNEYILKKQIENHDYEPESDEYLIEKRKSFYDQKAQQEKNVFNKIKQLNPNTSVLVKQGNLNDMLKSYVKTFNSCPKVKYESKTNVKTIVIDKKQKIQITTTETIVSNKLIQNICENEEIEYKNQSLGTLLNDLVMKFYKKKSTRKKISDDIKQIILTKQNNKCNICECLLDAEFHTDHIRP